MHPPENVSCPFHVLGTTSSSWLSIASFSPNVGRASTAWTLLYQWSRLAHLCLSLWELLVFHYLHYPFLGGSWWNRQAPLLFFFTSLCFISIFFLISCSPWLPASFCQHPFFNLFPEKITRSPCAPRTLSSSHCHTADLLDKEQMWRAPLWELLVAEPADAAMRQRKAWAFI